MLRTPLPTRPLTTCSTISSPSSSGRRPRRRLVEPDWIIDRIANVSGLAYGPAFLDIDAAWRRDGEIFSEVSLSDQFVNDAAGFGVHPALFDIALHAGFAQFALAADLPPDKGRLLFSWAGVRCFATGATRLRVRSAPSGAEGFSVAAVDETGRPVLSIDEMVFRHLRRGLARTNQAD